MKNGKRLTTLGMVLALVGGVAGCGGSKPESALHKELKRVRAGACRSEVFNTVHCGDEMQKVCETSVGSGSGEPAERHIYCELASSVRAQVKKNEEAATPTQEHTPEEEAAHNRSLETEQREEKDRALAQKKVEEDETRVEGGTSIRKTEEKVCYESGKTSEECKGPLKETPQEERSEAENKARQQQGQEESTGKPAVVE